MPTLKQILFCCCAAALFPFTFAIPQGLSGGGRGSGTGGGRTGSSSSPGTGDPPTSGHGGNTGGPRVGSTMHTSNGSIVVGIFSTFFSTGGTLYGSSGTGTSAGGSRITSTRDSARNAPFFIFGGSLDGAANEFAPTGRSLECYVRHEWRAPSIANYTACNNAILDLCTQLDPPPTVDTGATAAAAAAAAAGQTPFTRDVWHFIDDHAANCTAGFWLPKDYAKRIDRDSCVRDFGVVANTCISGGPKPQTPDCCEGMYSNSGHVNLVYEPGWKLEKPDKSILAQPNGQAVDPRLPSYLLKPLGQF